MKTLQHEANLSHSGVANWNAAISSSELYSLFVIEEYTLPSIVSTFTVQCAVPPPSLEIGLVLYPSTENTTENMCIPLLIGPQAANEGDA